MTSWHIFFDVPIKERVESHVGRACVFRLLIQLHEETFEMLTKCLFIFLVRGVEGL